MAAQNQRIRLNLLYPQGVAQKLPLKFLRWLISSGRYIVVIVEVVVLVTFAARFKLDADLEELNRQINNQVPFIESLTVDESLIKQTHKRLEVIRGVYQTARWKEVLDKLSSLTPAGVKLTSLGLEPNPVKFRLSGIATSNDALDQYIKSLKRELKDVRLQNINFDQSALHFTITGGLK